MIANHTKVLIKLCVVLSLVCAMAEATFFDTSFVELDTSKMVTTGDSNYAICNHHFPSNWRTASVNGPDATITTKDKQVITKKYHALTVEERSSLEAIKNSLYLVVARGPFNIKSETGFCKLTTFDRHGGTSTMGSGGGGSSGSSSSSSSMDGGMTVSKTGDDSFIVWKPDFLFGWLRLFVNADVVTIVYTDGRVIMMPQDLLKSEEHAEYMKIKKYVDSSSEAALRMTHSMLDSIKNPFDFVNKALSGFFG